MLNPAGCNREGQEAKSCKGRLDLTSITDWLKKPTRASILIGHRNVSYLAIADWL